jgi:putative transposase
MIDLEYLENPFYGKRRMTAVLNRVLIDEGLCVNMKRVSRLMQLMCIEAIYPKKRLSQPDKNAVKYPYLLRGLTIDSPNQVWATDITYIRMRSGFLYMTAVIDWYSRYILSWDLSNTMDVSFCASVVKRALALGFKPEIFNTDQGSQYTSREFTDMLESASIRVSQDGRGRALDNRMIERFWRSLKYEEVYQHDYTDGIEAITLINRYINKYNNVRPHQSLNYHTPAEFFTHPAKERH